MRFIISILFDIYNVISFGQFDRLVSSKGVYRLSTLIGINGFGRMGRLALRAAWGWPELAFGHINELHADAATSAHLLTFDSLHGRWHRDVRGEGSTLAVDDVSISYSRHPEPGAVPWGDLGAEVVLECSGKFRTPEVLDAYFQAGVRKVIVAAPVKHGALNIVMGVNDHWYDPAQHHLLTSASCTTNCLAPIVKVIHEGIGIRHGIITTIHDMTNTQTVVDAPSTMVVDGTQVKILAWYDNEWGYANRLVELARKVALGLDQQQ
jgi:glyceraldehyde 3-phosphate dehydrogenase